MKIVHENQHSTNSGSRHDNHKHKLNLYAQVYTQDKSIMHRDLYKCILKASSIAFHHESINSPPSTITPRPQFPVIFRLQSHVSHIDRRNPSHLIHRSDRGKRCVGSSLLMLYEIPRNWVFVSSTAGSETTVALASSFLSSVRWEYLGKLSSHITS